MARTGGAISGRSTTASPCTCGGTRRCFASSARPCGRARALRRASRRRGGAIDPPAARSTRSRCCGGCICSASTAASAGARSPRATRRREDVGYYAFNDLFALLAFVGAGDLGQAPSAACRRRASAPTRDAGGDNRDDGARGRPAADARPDRLRRGPCTKRSRQLHAGARHRAPLRRQPRAARPDRPDLARGLRERFAAPLARARAAQRAAPRQAGDEAHAHWAAGSALAEPPAVTLPADMSGPGGLGRRPSREQMRHRG